MLELEDLEHKNQLEVTRLRSDVQRLEALQQAEEDGGPPFVHQRKLGQLRTELEYIGTNMEKVGVAHSLV